MKRFPMGDDSGHGKRQKHAAASVAESEVGMKEDSKEDPKVAPPPYTADDFKADFGRLLRCVDELAEQREKIFKAVNSSLATIAAECLADMTAGPAAGIIVPDEPPAAAEMEGQLPDSQPDSQLADSQHDPELEVPPPAGRTLPPPGGILTLW